MKILHTADWHIGKQLKKVDFYHDMELFFDWLLQRIENEKVDVLLMSGDLFDHANPSQTALTQYYDFLKKLIKLKYDCKIIITGGNHDSPMVLEAPKEILHLLDITVVGGYHDKIEELFVEVEKNGEKIVVAAVPFLRDRDIRKAAPGESYQEKSQQIKEGLATFFRDVNTYYQKHYSDVPFVVMAHLFTHGASSSDSERDIQIGNLAGIESNIFQNVPDYVALGHIHKPQKAGAEYIRYSGSPIAFSFSEKEDKKQVVELNFSDGKLSVNPVLVPMSRKLVSFRGTLEEVKGKIEHYQSDSPLPDFGEVVVREENEDYIKIQEMLALKKEYTDKNLYIIESRIEFENQVQKAGDLFKAGDEIGNYSPLDLFKKRLEQEEGLQEDEEDLMAAFKEVLEEMNQDNNETN